MLLARLSKWDWVVAALVVVALVLCGLAVGFWWCLHELAQERHWNVSPEISVQLDPLNLVASLVTAIISFVLAIVVVRAFSNKDQADRVERDLLIKHFTNFDTEFEEKIKDFASGGVSVTTVAGVLKRYSMRMQELCSLGVGHGLLTESSSAISELMEKIRDIVPLLTNTPKEGEIEDGIRVEDDKLYYSAAHVDKIARAVYEVRSRIFKVVVEINRR